MGLVNHEERSRIPREPPELPVEAVVGQNDPDVRERRLTQDCRHVARGQLGGQRVEIIELHHPRGRDRVDGRRNVSWPRPGASVGTDDDEGLIDAAVVTVREDQNLGPAGEQPGESKCPAVGIGRREGE